MRTTLRVRYERLGPPPQTVGTQARELRAFSSFPELTGNDLYYELTVPNEQPTYHQLASDLPMGQPSRVAVLEMYGRAN